MDREEWDARYEASELVWSAGPNVWVEEVAATLPPGRALDLAAGEGRNALWLAERGWTATAIDFSQVAVDRARALGEQRLGDDAYRFEAHQGDVLRMRPLRRTYDLVLLVYLHLTAPDRWLAIRTAAIAVAPGGLLLVVGHDTTNITDGHGGPQDPDVLFTPADIVDDLDGTGLGVERAERVVRPVETDSGTVDAIDALVVARRPA